MVMHNRSDTGVSSWDVLAFNPDGSKNFNGSVTCDTGINIAFHRDYIDLDCPMMRSSINSFKRPMIRLTNGRLNFSSIRLSAEQYENIIPSCDQTAVFMICEYLDIHNNKGYFGGISAYGYENGLSEFIPIKDTTWLSYLTWADGHKTVEGKNGVEFGKWLDKIKLCASTRFGKKPVPLLSGPPPETSILVPTKEEVATLTKPTLKGKIEPMEQEGSIDMGNMPNNLGDDDSRDWEFYGM